MDTLAFINAEQATHIAHTFGTPVYVYDEATLLAQAQAALAFPNAFGLTVRYAMKASPNAAILKRFAQAGLHIDASSGFEVARARRAGIAPEKISLSTQELPHTIGELMDAGVFVNACSLHQIEMIGQQRPGSEIGVRFNPGLGSGGTGKTNVGGPDSSFGIWHSFADEVKALLEKYKLTCVRLHTHIGSGSDPVVWQRVSLLSLALVKQFPAVSTLNLGGGYKVARVEGEKSTDLQTVGQPVKAAFEAFAKETGRQLKLEIEPGTFLVANACALLSRVQDIVHTDARTFYKLDSGMTDILRPSLYGAQHPIAVLAKDSDSHVENVVVVGHCCESGDLLTPAPGEPETIAERTLKKAAIGDLCLVGGAGAYCASMSAKNYNSFPESAEVILSTTGQAHLIRHRQTLDQILQNECA